MILPIANVRKQNPIITPRYPNNGRIHMVEAILGIVEMQLMTGQGGPQDSRFLVGGYYIAIPCAIRVVTGAYYVVFGSSASSSSSTLLAALETIT